MVAPASLIRVRTVVPCTTTLPDCIELPVEGNNSTTLSIGRDISNDVKLDCQIVPRLLSKLHARITVDVEGTHYVADNASLNGTYLNGNLLIGTGPNGLKNGDIIGFGGPARVIRDSQEFDNSFRYRYFNEQQQRRQMEVERLRLEAEVDISEQPVSKRTRASADPYGRVRQREKNDLSCSICQDILLNAVSIGCGHTFCSDCISNWLHRTPICPICRLRSVPSQIAPAWIIRNMVDSHAIPLVAPAGIDDRNRRLGLIAAATATTALAAVTTGAAASATTGAAAIAATFHGTTTTVAVAEATIAAALRQIAEGGLAATTSTGALAFSTIATTLRNLGGGGPGGRGVTILHRGQPFTQLETSRWDALSSSFITARACTHCGVSIPPFQLRFRRTIAIIQGVAYTHHFHPSTQCLSSGLIHTSVLRRLASLVVVRPEISESEKTIVDNVMRETSARSDQASAIF
jgi:pSer/pThr/pTyr-binding forkhead associated (FHA) protein